MNENAQTVPCQCCHNLITIELQERRVKAPIILVTCREDTCDLNDVTIAVESIQEYLDRDLSDKYDCNR